MAENDKEEAFRMLVLHYILERVPLPPDESLAIALTYMKAAEHYARYWHTLDPKPDIGIMASFEVLKKDAERYVEEH